MHEEPSHMNSVVPPLSWLIPAAVLVALATLLGFWWQQDHAPLSGQSVAISVVGFGVFSALLFGPSRLLLTIVFLYFLTAPIFAPPSGPWHPGDVLLLMLLAHGVIKFGQRRYSFSWSPLHLCILVIVAYYISTALRGLWMGALGQSH